MKAGPGLVSKTILGSEGAVVGLDWDVVAVILAFSVFLDLEVAAGGRRDESNNRHQCNHADHSHRCPPFT
ncbi:MAG: hypothetical protein C4293_18170 [Nitrospiraceae bacterium]